MPRKPRRTQRRKNKTSEELKAKDLIYARLRKTHSEEETLISIQSVVAQIQSEMKTKVNPLHSNRGGEYQANVNKDWMLDKVTGKVTVHRDEETGFPSPDEKLLTSNMLADIDHKVNDYGVIQRHQTRFPSRDAGARAGCP